MLIRASTEQKNKTTTMSQYISVDNFQDLSQVYNAFIV